MGCLYGGALFAWRALYRVYSRWKNEQENKRR